MKITSIPQLARNVSRLREIITVLSKYSLADWISRLDLDFARRFYTKRGDGRTLPELTHETRIRLALTELAEELAQYRPRATAAEFQRTLLRELDFGREERNLQQFTANFAADPTVHFPTPRSDASTGRLLTMELLEGIPLAQPQQLREGGYDLDEIARRGHLFGDDLPRRLLSR